MTASLRLAATLLATLMLGACACPTQPKPVARVPVSYAVLLESPDGSTGRITIRGAQGQQTIQQAGDAALLDGSRPPGPIPPAIIQRDFGAALAARPAQPVRYLLYFESGGAKLTAASLALLPKIIETAGQRPGVDISIIGHSDTVGKAEANTALALRRAQGVGALLREQGLRATAISTESHGEANPLIQTPDETPEPRNRRVEVSIR